jgi:hypothetical protein
MSDRQQKLQQAIDVLRDVDPDELEADNEKEKLGQVSINTLVSGLSDLVNQLPEE